MDDEIPSKAIKRINSIPGLEPRSSCQGQDENHPTFLIFRLPEAGEKKIQRFCEELKGRMDNTYCDYDIGNKGAYRIGAAALLWPDKDRKKFRKWWTELAETLEDMMK